MLGQFGTSRLIRLGPIRPPVRPSKGQSGVLQAIDHSVARSMTAQPPGIRPSALQVATHGQQVASLGGGLTPLQRCSRYILQPQPTGWTYSSLLNTAVTTMLWLFNLRQNALFGNVQKINFIVILDIWKWLRFISILVLRFLFFPPKFANMSFFVFSYFLYYFFLFLWTIDFYFYVSISIRFFSPFGWIKSFAIF